MEEVGRKAAEKAAKGIWAKIKGALGIGEAELEVSEKGIRARAPSVEKAKELVDYGVETLLKLPQTAELLSRADKKELEDPVVRRKKIKRSEDAQRLLEAPRVKALPYEEKLLFSAFAFIAYGDESFHSQAFPEAEKAYRQAYEFAQELGDKPLQAICLNLIGAALGMQAEHEKALPCFDEAVRFEPDLAYTWHNKGIALDHLGRHKEALACFDEAVKLKPDFAEAWINKGAALGELEQDKEALACFDEAVKLKPDDAGAWYNKGVALGHLEQYKEALAYFDEAIKLEPEFADAWINKGIALDKLEQLKEALACFDEAVKLKADNADAWINKGAALGELGQHKEALACFDEAVKLKPDDADAWYNEAVALQRLGLESIGSRDMKGAEERALQLVKLGKGPDKDIVAQAVREAMREFKERLSRRELKFFDEFEVMFTFLAIEDPFERWRFLKKEIGKRWPKGVSAVEAIREQREG